jgi:hypothetical protein
MHTLSRLTPVLIITGLLLAGCAHQPPPPRSTHASTSTAASTAQARDADHAAHAGHAASTRGVAAEDANLPDTTGIAACDDYLSSYIACHRAAAIYAPDQIESRYEAMRTSLLRDSQKPDVRPQLAARCNSLATQLRQALHGKSCSESPAPASSTP